MHTHTAPSATRLQKIVEQALTQRHSDALTSVCTDSPAPSVLTNAASTEISYQKIMYFHRKEMNLFKKTSKHQIRPK